MREPVSTITNAFYILAGVFVLAGYVSYADLVYGAALIGLGIASGGFHATLSGRWQTADECMMYVVLCALLPLHGFPAALAYACAAALCVAWKQVSSFVWVPALVAANTLLIALQSPGSALTLVVIALVAFALRQWGDTLSPGGKDVAHGFWHLLTAHALLFAS